MNLAARFARPEVVRVSADGYFEFIREGVAVYDLRPRDAGQALRWVEHLARKHWITTEHLCQFARLSAEHFGAERI